jgi:hypothetical protein
MKSDSMLLTAIEYAYDFSRVYYYAGYFWYANSKMHSTNMGPFQTMPS